jgi:transposase
MFTREFKLEAVKLVRERGVKVAQAARDLGVGENVLGRWVREAASGKGSAFPRSRGDESRSCGGSATSQGVRSHQGGARHLKNAIAFIAKEPL